MAHREAKLNYDALMLAAQEAKREVASWPSWKRQVAAASFVSRPAEGNPTNADPHETGSTKPER